MKNIFKSPKTTIAGIAVIVMAVLMVTDNITWEQLLVGLSMLTGGGLALANDRLISQKGPEGESSGGSSQTPEEKP